MTVKRKCWISFWLATIPLVAGGASSLKSFLIKQISECTTKTVYVTSTTGRTTKGLKNKVKTIHLFAGIGDCHGPNEVFCVFQVLSGTLKRCRGVLLCHYCVSMLKTA